ncbi:MAG: hypothetical protein VKL39_09725 [Leptolyngbyaceae bacterium]|nr:hypothetical protein [Leptolyngbyaceae bacterium]
MMKAIETTAVINDDGQLSLDHPLELTRDRRVRVIVLIADEEEESSGEETDLDDTPTHQVLDGLREGLGEALRGQTIPLSQMWDGVDAN